MKQNKISKIRRIALAAALSSTMFAATPEFGFAQTASDIFVTLASQVQAYDFAASRATIRELQQKGIVAITVGTETITLEELLAMIVAAEEGRMDPVALAGYLRALAENTGLALFVPAPVQLQSSQEFRGSFPIGSEG